MATPGDANVSMASKRHRKKGKEQKGISEQTKALLMIDDDNIMDSRDSHKMGNYMTEQKMGLLNEDLEKEMGKNQEMKRRMRQRMVDKNAAKKARMQEQIDSGKQNDSFTKANEVIEKARRNQSKLPPENFRQQLGYDPFHCETISSENSENLAANDLSELDEESMWQRNKGQRDQMTKKGRAEESSFNESVDFEQKNKFLRQRTRSPTKRKNKKKKDKDEGGDKNARIGDQLDKLYGPEEDKIKQLLTKKTVERLQKRMQKAITFDKNDKGLFRSPTRHVSSPRQFDPSTTPGYTPGMGNDMPDKINEGYDFKDDYSSSDYDYISDEEIRHMENYQKQNIDKFNNLKQMISQSPEKRGKSSKGSQGLQWKDLQSKAKQAIQKMNKQQPKTGAGDILQAQRTKKGNAMEAAFKQGIVGMFADSDTESDTPGFDGRKTGTVVNKNRKTLNGKVSKRGKQSLQRDSQRSVNSRGSQKQENRLTYANTGNQDVNQGGMKLRLKDNIPKMAKINAHQAENKFQILLDAESNVRRQLLNNIVMDENRKVFEQRHLKRPQQFYSAQHDANGDQFDNEYNPRPDYMVKPHEDIGTQEEHQQMFMVTRVLQKTNLRNNLVNLFTMDFGHPDNEVLNRFDLPIALEDDDVESIGESADEAESDKNSPPKKISNAKSTKALSIKHEKKITLNKLAAEDDIKKYLEQTLYKKNSDLLALKEQMEIAKDRVNQILDMKDEDSNLDQTKMSQRPSFLDANFQFKQKEKKPKLGAHDHDHGEESACSSEDEGQGRKRDLPMTAAQLKANLNNFKADQAAELAQNQFQFMSPEERAKLEKSKLKVKQHFQKFFRHHAVKKHKRYFNIWAAYVEGQKAREQEFQIARKTIQKKKNYEKKKKDEKDKQMSKMLLDGFKALNQNTMKNNDGGGADETIAADVTQVGANEEGEAFQNFQATKPKKHVINYPLMKHIFSCYRQTLRASED